MSGKSGSGPVEHASPDDQPHQLPLEGEVLSKDVEKGVGAPHVIRAHVDEELLSRSIRARAPLSVMDDPLINEITYEFRKNRGLIRSSGVLTRGQRKLMNILAWNAMSSMAIRTFHEISLAEIEAILSEGETGGSQRRTVLATLRELRRIEIELHYDTSGRPSDDTTVTGILGDFKYSPQTGRLIYAFQPITAALLSDVSYAGQLDVRLQARMRTKYSGIMLEIAYAYLAEGETPMQTVDEWRRDFNILEDVTYSEYRFFNSKILQPSIREVRETANIDIKMEVEKSGRRVVGMRFVLKRLADSETAAVRAIAIRSSPLWKRLEEIGVSPAVAMQAIMRDEKHAAEVADVTIEKYQSGEIRKPAAWAANMLIKHLPVQSPLEQKTKAKAAAAKARKEKKDPDSLSAVQLKNRYTTENRAYIRRRVDEALAAMTPEEVLEKARYLMMKLGNRELTKRIQEGTTQDGGLNQETLNYLAQSPIFRGALYNLTDPGGVMRRKHLAERFTEAIVRQMEPKELDF